VVHLYYSTCLKVLINHTNIPEHPAMVIKTCVAISAVRQEDQFNYVEFQEVFNGLGFIILRIYLMGTKSYIFLHFNILNSFYLPLGINGRSFSNAIYDRVNVSLLSNTRNFCKTSCSPSTQHDTKSQSVFDMLQHRAVLLH
jgi:hypothetical protein